MKNPIGSVKQISVLGLESSAKYNRLFLDPVVFFVYKNPHTTFIIILFTN